MGEWYTINQHFAVVKKTILFAKTVRIGHADVTYLIAKARHKVPGILNIWRLY